MSATSERVRAELQTQTGVDFRRYADDDLIDAVTGWTGLLGLAKDFAISFLIGLSVILAAVIVALATGMEAEADAGLIVGGVVAGLGVMVGFFALRARRRGPAEAAGPGSGLLGLRLNSATPPIGSSTISRTGM